MVNKFLIYLYFITSSQYLQHVQAVEIYEAARAARWTSSSFCRGNSDILASTDDDFYRINSPMSVVHWRGNEITNR